MTLPRLAWRPPSAWTLRSKLVASTMLLFVAMSLVTGAATAYALGGFLMNQLDSQVHSAMMRMTGPGPDHQAPAPAAGGSQALPPGLGAGFLQVEVRDGTVGSSVAVTPDNTRVTLTSAQSRRLLAAGLGGRPTSVDLGGRLGTFRLVAAPAPDGTTMIVGRSTQSVHDTVASLSVIIAIVSSAALIGVAAGGTWLVRANLRPLRRVASTASTVSRLPLDSGAVALAERVERRDTDRRTEIGQVGAALNEMLDHVGEALTARHQSEMRVRQFVADASHELRSPLATIQGYAELSRRERQPVPPSVVHALERVESESHRMAALVDDLLLLARLDAGRPLSRDEVDLTRLAVEAVGDAHAAGRGHTWTLEVPEEPVTVTGDVARLQQVVLNLLTNARAHTPAGTTVEVAVRRRGDEAELTVTDDGPGIPPDLLPHVFTRFARGDSSRSRAEGSTGLGLSIVEAVARAHHGRLGVESVPGRTRLVLVLPVHHPVSGRPQPPHRVDPQGGGHGLPDASTRDH